MEIEILKHKIDYWYEEDQEMPEHEQNHVENMIMKGYNQGQLVDNDIVDDFDNYGWWKIIRH